MRGQNRFKKKLILGITGSFGSGKTTVAKMFKEDLNALLIDADKIAHQIINRDREIKEKLIKYFSKKVIKKNNKINWNRLARVVFASRENVRKINSITHPKIIQEIKEKINTTNKQIIILDAPLLIETGLNKIVDILIVVKTNLKSQLIRLKKRGFSEDEIRKRLNFQIPLEEKIKLADFIINNNGSINKTKEQIIKIVRRLKWRRLRN